MERSESINELATALGKAQAAIAPARKSGTNPHLKNKYATLDDIIEAVRGPLTDNGLSFLQLLDSEGNGPTLTTMLLHQSGQWVAAKTPIDAMESHRGTNEMQAFGATLTYLKRYALASMLGVSSDEDTDGEGARAPRRIQAKPEPQPEDEPAEPPPERPYAPLHLREMIARGINKRQGEGFTFEDDGLKRYRGAMNNSLELCFVGDKHSDQKRHFVLEYLTGKASSTKLDDAEVKTIHRWLGARKDEETGEWEPDPLAVSEAREVARVAERDAGQQALEL